MSVWLKAGFALALAAVAAFGGLRLTGAALERAETPEAAGPRGASSRPLVVETVSPTRMTFSDEIRATGTTRARRAVDIRPKVAGLVAEVAFSPGQRVQQGAVLARLDDASERAALKAAEATLAEARATMDRQARLRGTGAATEAVYQAAEAAALRAEAERDLAETELADRTITAPFAGVVGLSDLELGALVDPATLVTTLDDLEQVEVAFHVPERFLAGLATGLPVTLMSAAWPDRTFAGEVTAINTRVDEATRAIQVRALIDNGDHALAGGMFMEVQLSFARREVEAVPEAALIVEGPRSYVYLLDGGVVRRSEVVTGRSREDFVEVAGLDPASVVITSNLHRIEDGAPAEAMTGTERVR